MSGGHWLTEYVNACGSKRLAAHRLCIPRGTLRRWLKEIDSTGTVHSAPRRVQALSDGLEATYRGTATADAPMGIWGFHRAGRGDDMTCASFPGEDFVVHKELEDGKRGFSENMRERIRNSQTANEETKQRVNTKGVHNSRIVDVKARKRKTVLFLYDIHLPNHSEENIGIALDYAQSRHEIDTVVLGGDFLDCAGISKFNNDPNECVPLVEEIARGVEFLDMLRKRFPAASIRLVKGNHEQRLQRFLWEKAVELNGLKGLAIQDQLELERFNVEWIDNLQRIRDGLGAYKIGKLFVLHGHELGICPSVDCARKYFFKALENIIVGHVHRDDKHTETTLDGTKGAWVVGHLQDEHPAYRAFNKWVAGFAIASFDDDGLFSVKNKTIIQGRVL